MLWIQGCATQIHLQNYTTCRFTIMLDRDES